MNRLKILEIPKEINVEVFFQLVMNLKLQRQNKKRKIELDNLLYFEEYGKAE